MAPLRIWNRRQFHGDRFGHRCRQIRLVAPYRAEFLFEDGLVVEADTFATRALRRRRG
ncbi:hypothetical protein [Sphingomonas sp.]|uniref:hypothetical protein n=1 Tax=Sphingomonas sp. TaxID=28214 RepID=UPI003B3A0757